VTASLLALSVVGFLAVFFGSGSLRVDLLAFVASRAPFRPWSLVTYPFLSTEPPFFLLLTLYWLFLVGRDLEASEGTGRFALLFAGSAIASALGIFAYAFAAGQPGASLFGLYLPLSGITVAWCLRNPGRVVLFSFLVPLSGTILAILTVLLVYFSNGPLRGLFSLGGCLFGFLWVRWRRFARPVAGWSDPWSRPGRRGERLTLAERYRLWRARRRMKKVWDADDPGAPGGRSVN
jgi:membrane associated rhomboid family serine protease